jgi:hypothetical protein
MQTSGRAKKSKEKDPAIIINFRRHSRNNGIKKALKGSFTVSRVIVLAEFSGYNLSLSRLQ